MQLSEQTVETKLFLFPKYVNECLFSVDYVPSAVTPGVMRTVLETCEDFIHYYKEYLKYFMGNDRRILAVNSWNPCLIHVYHLVSLPISLRQNNFLHQTRWRFGLLPMKTSRLILSPSSSHSDVKKESYNSCTAWTTSRRPSPATDIKPWKKSVTLTWRKLRCKLIHNGIDPSINTKTTRTEIL